jgi:hypothetical protein
MMDKAMLTENSKIFATGVFLQPVQCVINGKEQFRWVAVSFEDDSYFDGQVVDPTEYADTLQQMINAES